MHCLKCLAYIDEGAKVCPICNSVVGSVKKVEATDLEPGTELDGHYIIGQSIAHGGFGIVYKAFDRELDNVVAIKEFYPRMIVNRVPDEKEVTLVNDSHREEFNYRRNRFKTEARNLAQFSSNSAIVDVYKFFDENGTTYISMEYIDGESLETYVKSLGGPIKDLDLAMKIITDIGNAVVELHAKRIIHRDIAPDNIILSVKPILDVKLLDFGSAQFADEDISAKDIVVKHGFSPYEQYNASSEPSNIDERSDVYALGATMYYMLVGESPAPAQNRFDHDTVVAPHDRDSSIPVNVSNAVMKAIAIDKEYRYESVAAFLRDLSNVVANKKRKVSAPQAEKNRRKVGRVIGIIAACLLVVALGFGIFMLVKNLRGGGKLKDAEISIWYMAEEGSDKQDAMENMVEEFNEKYPNVEIELRAIAPDDYISELQAAYDNDEMPTLFESSIISSDIIDSCIELDDVLSSSEAKNCLFLDQFEECYEDNKQIPLGVDIPFACVITNGNKSTNYRSDYFVGIEDFSSSSNVALDSNSEFIAIQNFDVNGLAPESAFLNASSNTSAVLITSTMDESRVRDVISAYEYKYVYYNDDEIFCMFVDEWSVSDAEEDEAKAATRFLTWMLGYNFQSELYVNNETSGAFPICEKAFMDKMDTNSFYAPIEDIYDNFVLVQYDPEATGLGIYVPDKLNDFIAKLYQEIYGREAADVEISYVAEIVNNGSVSITNYADYMIRSYECTSRHLSNEEFVRMVYSVFCNREPDAEGLEYQAGRLEGGMSRTTLIREFEHNDEWYEYCQSMRIAITCDADIVPDTPQGEFVYELFVACLNRMPDPGAYEFYLNSAMSQPAKELVRAFTIDSDEFNNRNISDEEFIRMVYVVVLGRNAAEVEVTNATALFANGTTREQYLESVFNSNEWHNRASRDGLVDA